MRPLSIPIKTVLVIDIGGSRYSTPKKAAEAYAYNYATARYRRDRTKPYIWYVDHAYRKVLPLFTRILK